ncbi:MULTISPECIES: hypothetical protein [Cyanophyceae]|uniref:hypothetical protein n=1 Tax=Cyanophyceae TaxID=3028117 RepID=UPI001683033B|nr:MULTISPECIES: hypothetical protein [Cyanophyceae]MBD1914830.1 hypothetical protein [Phormidium sp. FACHB-77]MBD2029948.1 hypothetical protein [Phormidium sp. FACHB-322]MBD2049258.1 hypothetical protein [Leptolyngbya sp. FACHB-60]
MTVNAIASKLQRLLCVGLATLVIGSSLVFGFSTPAAALGNEAGDIVQQRAESELDRISKDGDTVNQVKVRLQEGLGGVPADVDKGTKRGLSDRELGKAQRTLDRTQNAVEDAGNAAKDSAEGVVDSVKGFFNR